MRYALFAWISVGWLIAPGLQAQELWLEATGKAQLTNRLEASLEEQLRFRDHVTEWRTYLNQLGMSYAISDAFGIKGNYRYGSIHRKENEHRFAFDVKYKRKAKERDWVFTYRMRVQHEWEVDGTNELTGFRNKLEFKNNFNKLAKPFVSGELFHIWDPQLTANRYRLTLGLQSRIFNVIQLETYVRYQADIETEEEDFGNIPDRSVIVGISLSYTYKRKERTIE